jgi:1-acyl-sn-glycerol-3-phosphate acyltransferase
MSRLERRIRSSVFASTFTVANVLTRHEIFGQEHLLAAIGRSRCSGRGLITVSNHQSLFDDPMLIAALLGIRDLSCESKIWWSTPCQTNFSPNGKSLRDRFVRYFSDVSNMVFFARPGKKGQIPVPDHYLESLSGFDRDEVRARIENRAAALGLPDGESYMRRFVTPGSPQHMAPLNQLGMVEACARVDLGYWLHFFPEATRSRGLELGSPKRGVGKVLYHCPDADVLPFCFCGMHTVMPVGATLPRPLQRVVVFIGEPVPARKLAELRRGAPTPERFQALASAAWEPIQSLWPLARARYERSRPLVTPFWLPQRQQLRPSRARVPQLPVSLDRLPATRPSTQRPAD